MGHHKAHGIGQPIPPKMDPENGSNDRVNVVNEWTHPGASAEVKVGYTPNGCLRLTAPSLHQVLQQSEGAYSAKLCACNGTLSIPTSLMHETHGCRHARRHLIGCEDVGAAGWPGAGSLRLGWEMGVRYGGALSGCPLRRSALGARCPLRHSSYSAVLYGGSPSTSAAEWVSPTAL